jgi:hypothetical protein
MNDRLAWIEKSSEEHNVGQSSKKRVWFSGKILWCIARTGLSNRSQRVLPPLWSSRRLGWSTLNSCTYVCISGGRQAGACHSVNQTEMLCGPFEIDNNIQVPSGMMLDLMTLEHPAPSASRDPPDDPPRKTSPCLVQAGTVLHSAPAPLKVSLTSR